MLYQNPIQYSDDLHHYETTNLERAGNLIQCFEYIHYDKTTKFERPHREKKFNWIKEISVYKIFICRQWKNLLHSMISFIWMTTESMKFSDIKSIKILFEPTKHNKSFIYNTVKHIFSNM